MSPEVSRELSGPTSLVVDGETEVWGRGGGREQASSALPGLLWQSDSLVVCEVDPELKEKLRKFRFRKETDNAAIISECHLLPWKDGREGGDKEVWASVTSGWEGRLTPVCHLFPVKVDKDRQMVVLEEEFQVRVWDGRDLQEVQGGPGRTRGLDDARSLALGARKAWRADPSSAVTLGKRHHLHGSLFPHL